VINICLCGCGPSTFFSKSLLLLQFAPVLTKLGTHDLRANTQKNVEPIFEISILKSLANF